MEWREAVAADPPKRHRGETYWARPLPGFGDPAAGVVVVGLAPAAHGANRTGRVFTGDRSGDWLFGAMHRAGLANQPESVSADDGLRLRGAWVTADQPLRAAGQQADAGRARHVPSLSGARARAAATARGSWSRWAPMRGTGRCARCGRPAREVPRPKPRFGHGAEAEIGPGERLGALTLLGCFHPSQQNTFTGRLTEPMIDEVFSRAKTFI